MGSQERDVQRKLKVLRHAEQSGCVAKTCRYFGVGRASFYRWRAAYEKRGEAAPKTPAVQRGLKRAGAGG
jgi:transposase-like protein